MRTPGRRLIGLAPAETLAAKSWMRLRESHRWRTNCARLDRLQELSKTVNSRTDEAGRIVQGVEKYLSDVLHIGVAATIRIDKEGDERDGWVREKALTYDRYGDSFRIFVEDAVLIGGEPDEIKQTLWANCPRDVKLLAFNALPALLDAMIDRLEGTLDEIKRNTETIESLFPHLKEANS